MIAPTRRHWAALLAAGALALLLTACGGPAVGDVEGQVLAMRDPAQQPVLLKGANVVLAGSHIERATQTDDKGQYRFKDVPAGDYGIAFSVPPQEGQPPLQPESRQFNVSSHAVETVSVVLLADGIARPTVPAELAQRGQAARNDPGLMSNPFFWYWMFNQPWMFGYPRPPVVVYAPGPERTVVIDRNQPSTPSTPGRSYSSYGPPGSPGTKPPPVESKGVTRPGQAPMGAGEASGPRAGNGGPSKGDGARPGQPSSPPRVGAGGGGTAGRAPGSGGSSPPRVSGGRR